MSQFHFFYFIRGFEKYLAIIMRYIQILSTLMPLHVHVCLLMYASDEYLYAHQQLESGESLTDVKYDDNNFAVSF
jgi:hypothetical protein